jgi:hypothetical protein
MKLEIIETRDYILSVSKNLDQLLYNTSIQELITKGHVKAHLPKGNAPELDLPLLPEMGVEDDAENLAKLKYPIPFPNKFSNINQESDKIILDDSFGNFTGNGYMILAPGSFVDLINDADSELKGIYFINDKMCEITSTVQPLPIAVYLLLSEILSV